MNSEQLEQSLRTEFENYLKTVVDGMRHEAADFQSRIEAEFEKQRAGFDEAFKAYFSRFDSEHTFDDAFRGSVAEHIRLARDEGARITADAMAEAEKLSEPVAAAETKYDKIRDAVSDISSKESQSAILKSLVTHVAEFAPRGAFFIIKNEHFVGWRVFGSDQEGADEAVREIHFPVSDDTVLGAAVRTLSTAEASGGTHSHNAKFTEPLGFGHPDRMHAIPLIARGRGVAVLYVDHGRDGVNLNVEALETLVRVAGLTVEMLASTQTARAENRQVGPADFEDAAYDAAEPMAPEARFENEKTADLAGAFEAVPEPPKETPFSFNDSVYMTGFPQPAAEEPSFEPPPVAADPYSVFDATEHSVTAEPVMQPEASPFDEPPTHKFEMVEEPVFDPGSAAQFDGFETFREPADHQDDHSGALTFDSGGSIEAAPVASSAGSIDLAPAVSSPFDAPTNQFEPSGGGMVNQIEPVIEASIAAPARPRLSERNVDLPIEVPDEERRIHNDARRFARLLVSEIKLYNEKKVNEGRQSGDLYARLREAIDRSREMYDKRVQPPVAARFDYFHYELVNSLADGDASSLGAGYPGSSV